MSSTRAWPVVLVVAVVAAACNGSEADLTTTTTLAPVATTTMPTTTTTLLALETPTVGPAALDVEVPDDAVVIGVGDDPQDVVDEHPEGTVFVFEAGVHVGAEIRRPKQGNEFYGEPGAVLDGAGVAAFAIAAYDDLVSDVIVRGLVIENYAAPAQLAPVGGGSSVGWVIEFNEIRESAAAGLQLGDGSSARGNHIHHNRQVGVKTGTTNRGVSITANEISHNNYQDEFVYEDEAGGVKVLHSTDITIEGNYVHANHGPGIWTDFNNAGATIRGNIVQDNYGPGIFHEISYDAVITGNVVERNAFEFYRGGILVASSTGAVVSHNVVVGNNGGIIAIDETRGEGLQGPFLVDRLHVHDNVVVYSEGVNGVYDNDRSGLVYQRDIVFESNAYDFGDLREPFRWDGDDVSAERWRGIHLNDG